MWENILIWVLVVAAGLIGLGWVYKILTGQKGSGYEWGCAACPLRKGCDSPSFSHFKAG
jgi:hypothetical protein